MKMEMEMKMEEERVPVESTVARLWGHLEEMRAVVGVVDDPC